VVDSSGAAIVGATVEIRDANGAIEKATYSDRNGFFVVPGLAPGHYRLLVVNHDFESKEVQVTVNAAATTEAQLRISLAVGGMSTTLKIEGREDDLTGIADSGTQGTIGAKELEDRPILRSNGSGTPSFPELQTSGNSMIGAFDLDFYVVDDSTAIFVETDGNQLVIDALETQTPSQPSGALKSHFCS